MSALMAPVTLTAGPVAAYNVAMVLGPVVSGVLMAVALVPWTQRWTSRLVAGGLYAFSPFQVAHLSVGHVNVVWAVLPPLVLVAVRALAVETPHRPTRAGVLAGGVLAVQTGLYTQTLALTALVLALVTVVLAVRWPHGLLTRGPAAARMTVACVVTYLVLCAYPLYLVLFGPTRPGGPIHPAVDVRADPLNAVIPTSLTATGGGSTTAGQLNSYTGEQGGYVGVVVLLLLVVACLGARSTVARVVTVVGLLAFTFSLGSSLTTRKQDLEVWLPWQLLDDLPLISQADPVRLQVFVAACVAIVVGLWIDRVASMRPGAGRITGAALAIGAVVSWLPAAPLPIAAAETPAFFRLRASTCARPTSWTSAPGPPVSGRAVHCRCSGRPRAGWRTARPVAMPSAPSRLTPSCGRRRRTCSRGRVEGCSRACRRPTTPTPRQRVRNWNGPG
ncbi:hypothetical protein [Geodermatophilus sp. SYSU D00700]